MFDEVRVCAIGSIHEAVLELHPGLTVLSGESGAGKSSVIRAFSLLAGGRADVGHIRSGCSSAAVEAHLTVDPQGSLAAQVREAGGELEGSSLIVARTISADGRSRAFVGGRAVPVGVLGELVGGMLALHGQSSQLQLRHPGAQRAALDRFAGPPVLASLEAYRAAREAWAAARRELAALAALESERVREVELLRIGLAEVERVAPVAGEDLDLDLELARLGAADELRCASETAHAALAGDSDSSGSADAGVVSALATAVHTLDAAAGSDPDLGAMAVRVREVRVLASELAADLASYAAAVEDDPRRLSMAQERRSELNRLCRPHGTGVDGVLEWASDAQRRLRQLDAGGERSAELAATEDAAAGRMLTIAAELSVARQAAARTLRSRLSAELGALSMTAARLEVVVESQRPPIGPATAAAGLLGADGADDVELMFAAGEGVALRPLARAASGGELSRVVLALEVVLAAGLGPASMVFDEVDAGIGGEAALEVGRRLAVLGRSRQVICVTHLPQVAAFASRHLLVAKTGRGAAVQSGVRALEPQERVRELSRMLAGVSDSKLARGHAAELLASAAAAEAAAESPTALRPRRRSSVPPVPAAGGARTRSGSGNGRRSVAARAS